MSKGCISKTKYANCLCNKHGGGTPCCYPNCKNLNRKARFNLCKIHGNGIACTITNCYNTADEKTLVCSIHTNTNKCKTAGCKDLCIRDSTHCVIHSSPSRCPNCVDWIDSRIGSKKYDGYCATCFPRCFPDDPRVNKIHSNNKEVKVKTFINQHFKGFIHNIPIYSHNCNCANRRRIDHYIPLEGTILAVETDEHQHRDYDDEEIRYNDLYMHFSGKWIFIRFNVHSYVDSRGTSRSTKFSTRLNILQTEITKQIERIKSGQNTELLEIVPLFYDGYDHLTVFLRYGDIQ